MEKIRSNEEVGQEFLEHEDFLTHNVNHIGFEAAKAYLVAGGKQAFEDQEKFFMREKPYENALAKIDQLAEKIIADLNNPATKEKATEDLKSLMRQSLQESFKTWISLPFAMEKFTKDDPWRVERKKE